MQIPFIYLGIQVGGNPRRLQFWEPVVEKVDGNQVEDAQTHEAQAQQGVQAQQGAQAQRITRSMARALGQEYNKMALLISFVE